MPRPTKDLQREYQRKWVAERRAKAMAGASCVRCGSTDSLELDHIDPKTKVDHKIWSWSQQRREAEIAKCQWLCQRCHIEKSLADRGSSPAKCGTLTRYRHGCRCDACRLAKSASQHKYRDGVPRKRT